MAGVRRERLVEELINHMQMIETFGQRLERRDFWPFYRWHDEHGYNNDTKSE